jgi:hypothetical protein
MKPPLPGGGIIHEIILLGEGRPILANRKECARRERGHADTPHCFTRYADTTDGARRRESARRYDELKLKLRLFGKFRRRGSGQDALGRSFIKLQFISGQ